MYQVSDKIVTFIPPEDIEPEAMQQIVNISQMPFLYKHVAVMPDCHFGKGATVGTVIATQGAVIPAAVGVDIGCGMIAVKTTLKSSDAWNTKENLEKIRDGLARRIPMSAGKFKAKISATGQDRIDSLTLTATEKQINLDGFSKNWREQLGTLGGGNHFIELCVDIEGVVWATLHSGSRGIGNKIGNAFIKRAQAICQLHHIQLPDPDLAYLSEGTEEFAWYINALNWAQKFALLNREEMMDQFLTELADVCLGDHTRSKDIELERINCHHNFSRLEEHLGNTVLVTRKGAIHADLGVRGMIPGSMGTQSFIVTGQANPMSFKSAPHGAGRRMSRSKARAAFNMDDFDKAMVGIVHRRDEAFLDEMPGAYKNIGEVMENAKELVTIETSLTQILNCKGE